MNLPVIELSPLSILWVEDNPLNRKVVSAMLLRRGHRVETAENGRQAIAMIIEGDYDLVLMDIMMPEMDGIELARVIRSSVTDKVDASIPILALTAYFSDSEKERYAAAGIDATLTKPVRVPVLLKAIQEVLERKGVTIATRDGMAQPQLVGVRDFTEVCEDFGLELSEVLELCEGLLVTLPREFSALKVAVQESWLDEVGDLAHSMAGSALDIVSEGPSLLAREIEHTVRSDGESDLGELCDELERQLGIVMEQLGYVMEGNRG